MELTDTRALRGILLALSCCDDRLDILLGQSGNRIFLGWHLNFLSIFF